MASLNDALIATFFGGEAVPRTLAIALARNGTELVDAGYRRQQVSRGTWRVRNGEAETDVGFGPFAAAVDFDEAWLVADDSVLDRAAIGSWRVPAAQRFQYSPSFTIKDAE